MTTLPMTPAMSEMPAPVKRSSDWMVLLLLVVAMLGAWALKERIQNASESVTVPGTGLSLKIPAGAIASEHGEDLYAASTASGLTVRVNRQAVPPIGADILGLLTFRARERGQQGGVFKSIETRIGEDPQRGMMEYQYVSQGSGKFFSTNLRLMHGYEMVIPSGDVIYYIALEGPDAKWDAIRAYWPRLVESVRIAEGK